MFCCFTAAARCFSLDATDLQREDESALLQHPASLPSSSLHPTHQPHHSTRGTLGGWWVFGVGGGGERGKKRGEQSEKEGGGGG